MLAAKACYSFNRFTSFNSFNFQQIIIPGLSGVHPSTSVQSWAVLYLAALLADEILSLLHRLDAGLFEGLVIRNRTQILPGQAVAAILFESLYSMTYRAPNLIIPNFDYRVSYPAGGVRYPLNATIHVVSTDLPLPYQLTNSRLSTALYTLGNLFNEHWDLNAMHEWAFDIAICYFSIGAINIIGRGWIYQGLSWELFKDV